MCGSSPGMVLKQFTAREVAFRRELLEGNTQATANTDVGFVDAVQGRMPFRVRAIQMDRGFVMASCLGASHLQPESSLRTHCPIPALIRGEGQGHGGPPGLS